MANTFELISSTVVGSGGASTIDFTSIPQTYTDLVLYVSGRVDSGFGNGWYDTYIKINSTAGTTRDLFGTGSAAQSGTDTEIRILGVDPNTATSNTFGNAIVYITNYASTSQYKSISVDSVSENNATSSITQLGASLYSSNTAITSISLDPYSTANFAQYSTAYLYGVKNA